MFKNFKKLINFHPGFIEGRLIASISWCELFVNVKNAFVGVLRVPKPYLNFHVKTSLGTQSFAVINFKILWLYLKTQEITSN